MEEEKIKKILGKLDSQLEAAGSQQYTCSKCGKIFESTEVSEPVLCDSCKGTSVPPGSSVCRKCGNPFEPKDELDNKSMLCDECGEVIPCISCTRAFKAEKGSLQYKNGVCPECVMRRQASPPTPQPAVAPQGIPQQPMQQESSVEGTSQEPATVPQVQPAVRDPETLSTLEIDYARLEKFGDKFLKENEEINKMFQEWNEKIIKKMPGEREKFADKMVKKVNKIINKFVEELEKSGADPDGSISAEITSRFTSIKEESRRTLQGKAARNVRNSVYTMALVKEIMDRIFAS